jgi:DNA helicase HerA-like ATPase
MKEEASRVLGVITKGSLTEGMQMKLDPGRSVEEIKAGKFVVIEGEMCDFFSMITDVGLDATSSQILINPPMPEDSVMKEILRGTNTYVTVSLKPVLMIRRDSGQDSIPEPVKTIPPHFASVREARAEDVGRVFGKEGEDRRFFNIGTPIDMDVPVCLDLERFVERSNGIFGKTGTGKTFLTRLVLAGIIRNEIAVNIIFDMHNEYGWSAIREEGVRSGGMVKGLKQLFPEKVAIFSLDPESTRRRNVSPDHEVWISLDQIEVEDIALLQEELVLHPTAIEAAYLIAAKYGRGWLKELLSLGGDEIKDFAYGIGAHPESVSALYRKLRRLQGLPFLVSDRPKGGKDVLSRMMEFINSGKHIVLEFGRQSSMLCYLLVANMITRMIHEHYVDLTERYIATGRIEDKPKQLVITIEEAHKFLNPSASRQTIFGTIAREMRKYNVSLLIVDQRPSSIDDEVLSQIGTRIIASLNDERDIQAVLTGVTNASGLRSVLASLDSKQQVLIMGHAVPMPVVIRTRDYDESFYSGIAGRREGVGIASLFGE